MPETHLDHLAGEPGAELRLRKPATEIREPVPEAIQHDSTGKDKVGEDISWGRTASGQGMHEVTRPEPR